MFYQCSYKNISALQLGKSCETWTQIRSIILVTKLVAGATSEYKTMLLVGGGGGPENEIGIFWYGSHKLKITQRRCCILHLAFVRISLKVIYHPLYGMNHYVLIWGGWLSCDPLRGSHDSQSPHIRKRLCPILWQLCFICHKIIHTI